MKKYIGTFFIGLFLISCGTSKNMKTSATNSSKNIKKEIAKTLNYWHKAAADADFETYFSYLTDDAIYIGTDASENWEIEAFKAYAKPHFDKGKAWTFEVLERNIYLAENRQVAWFDELLQTQMGLCRGSGVLVKNEGAWKIKHFVLSMTIPNDAASEVTQLKRDFDERYLQEKFSDED